MTTLLLAPHDDKQEILFMLAIKQLRHTGELGPIVEVVGATVVVVNGVVVVVVVVTSVVVVGAEVAAATPTPPSMGTGAGAATGQGVKK